jgi:hypothetical protein
MPQTIATQRGQVNVDTDGASETTLFTQSGGLGTRVIMNQLAGFTTSGGGSTMRPMLIYTSSSGFKTVLMRIDGASVTQWQFISGGLDSFAYATAGGGTNTLIGGTPYISGQSQSQQMGANNPSNVNPQSQISGGSMVGATNFWIGPGDAISIKVQRNSGTVTCTVAFCFTTITET